MGMDTDTAMGTATGTAMGTDMATDIKTGKRASGKYSARRKLKPKIPAFENLNLSTRLAFLMVGCGVLYVWSGN